MAPASKDDLRIGWLLDSPAQVAVNLRASGLKSHTAVIAQSGSGKSFALGRLLEEIVSKTGGRVLILDPNSDFGVFSEVNEEAWNDPKLVPWFDAADDQSEFTRRWQQVRMTLFTNRSSGPDLKHPDVKTKPISLDWAELKLLRRAEFLELSIREHPAEVYALSRAFTERMEDGKNTRTLKEFTKDIAGIWAAAAGLPENTLPDDWLRPEMSQSEVQASAAQAAYARVFELAHMAIWDQLPIEESLSFQVESLAKGDSDRRVVVVDLASLSDRREQLSVALTAAQGAWVGVRKAWAAALSVPKEKDPRRPLFLVIDEAHNLAPSEAKTGLENRLGEVLATIATEGRKYGLFLVVVTQRPTRVSQTLLSQCDNLCLLRMNNYVDLKLVEEVFGFVPRGDAKRSMEFAIGQALLAGNLVDRPYYVHIAPRRTAEGGRNLSDDVWLEDPAPRP